MFSPAANTIRQRLFGHIVSASSGPALGSPKPTSPDEAEDLDPDTLSGADQVAFFDLQEHEDRYNVLNSTRFDCSMLNFTHNLVPTDTAISIDVESVINTLPSNSHGTQQFTYRLNAMKILLDYMRTTQCAHPALVMQQEALITALTVDIEDLVQNAIKQWAVCTTGETKRYGLNLVHPEEHRDYIYGSPLALSIMVLTAIVHSAMGVSRESCNFVILSLKAILSLAASMQGVQAQRFIQQHLSRAPETLATTLHFLGLPPPLQLYVACPHCSTLYRELDHVYLPETCTASSLDGPVCGRPLFSNCFRGGRVRRKPIRRYSHQLFETWLAEILTRPGVEDMLESTTPSPNALLTDVWVGTYWENFLGGGENNFFDAPRDELRLCMLLYHDFFNPLRNKTAGKLQSIGCLYMVCLNLPPDVRYDTLFAYLVSIIPGPSEPSMEALQSFIRPIADKMMRLYDPGIWVSRTHKYPQGRKVRVSVPLNCMDTPAARGFGGFASHGHTCFCYLCSATLDRIGANTLSDFALRTVQSHQTQAGQWENAPSQASRNQLFNTHGVRSREWLRFGWWDMFSGTVIGPMHWIRNVLDKQLRRNMNWNWDLPTGIPSPPPLSRPISKLEYEWGQRALYELDGPLFMQYKLPEPLVRHLCRERSIYEAGLSARHLMTELNEWRAQCGIIHADSHLTQPDEHNDEIVPLSAAKAHYYLSKTSKCSTLQSHASAQDLGYLCWLFGLSSSGKKPVLADRLIAFYANIRVQDLPNTSEYSKRKKQTVAVLGTEVLTEIQRDMGQTTLPRWIKHLPKNFGTISHGKLQSEEYKSLALVSFVFTLVQLWGTEPCGPFRDRLDNFLHLMLAVRILSFQSLVESDIVAFEYHYGEYLRGLSQLYPYASRKPTQHMGLHIPAFLRALGPCTRLSKSTCEMFIGILQDISTNFKFGELEMTIHREFIMAARLKGLVEQESFSDGLGQFGKIAQKYLGGKFPGRVGSGWRTNRIAGPTTPDSDISLVLNIWATSQGILCLPCWVHPCSSIQQGNIFYVPYTHSAGDSCVIFCHPLNVSPHPGCIDIIIEDPQSGQILLLI